MIALEYCKVKTTKTTRKHQQTQYYPQQRNSSPNASENYFNQETKDIINVIKELMSHHTISSLVSTNKQVQSLHTVSMRTNAIVPASNLPTKYIRVVTPQQYTPPSTNK